MGDIKDKIHNWWYGQFHSAPGYMGGLEEPPHWTARAIRRVGKEYKWIISTILVAISVYAALK